MAANGGIRVVAADTTDLVREAVERHGAARTAGAALGRTLSGALLLSHVLLKNPQDRITLRLRGNGPLGGVIADAGLDGTVRGYAHDPTVELPPRADGKLDVGGAVGSRGDIEVIRSHAPYGDPYASNLELATGEVLGRHVFAMQEIADQLDTELVNQFGGVLHFSDWDKLDQGGVDNLLANMFG